MSKVPLFLTDLAKSSGGSSSKMYLAYLKTWPLSTALCILDKKNAKFYIKHWKDKTKTKLMKEIIKQLKATINGKGTN